MQELARRCGLVEKRKWGKPCFTLGNKNIVLIQRLNTIHRAASLQGALLKNPGKLLFRVGEYMQAPRQLRFNSVADITRLSLTMKAFIKQAIEARSVRGKG